MRWSILRDGGRREKKGAEGNKGVISLKQRRGLDVNLYEALARGFSTGVMGMVLAGEGV